MLELKKPSKDNELSIMAETRTETLLGSLRKKKGLTLYEFDPETKKIKEVEFTDTTADFFGKETRYSMKVKKGFKYCQALNMKNAIRRFKKMGCDPR